MQKPVTPLWLVLLCSAFFVISACRLADVMVQFSSHPPQAAANGAPAASNTQVPPSKTGTPTATSEVAMLARTISALQTRSWFPTAAPPETYPPEPTEDLSILPDETLYPIETPPTFVMPASAPTSPDETMPTETEVPTETTAPTPEFRYQIANPYCGPNWKTFVEGTATEGGEPIDGLLARISTNKGGDPAWSDYVTGTDPDKPGGYTQIIDARGPREGLWYVWLVDPDTNKRISEIATIKTDRLHVEDTDKSPGSCQSARIDFTSEYPAATPTEEPLMTVTPTSVGTYYTSTPSRTSTPYTATPTRTYTGTPPTATPTGTPPWTATSTWTPTRTPIPVTPATPITPWVPTPTPTNTSTP